MARTPLSIEEITAALSRVGGLAPRLGIVFERHHGRMRCRMPIDERHVGAPDVAHGGAVMTLLDMALGVDALERAAARGKATSTVELKVNFLRPAKVGTVLVTETTIEYEGKSLLVVSGRARELDSGRAVALAVGTFNFYAGDMAARLTAHGSTQPEDPDRGGVAAEGNGGPGDGSSGA